MIDEFLKVISFCNYCFMAIKSSIEVFQKVYKLVSHRKRKKRKNSKKPNRSRHRNS